ncbi:hypothetical protein F4779DRAFT_626561 [Xylariaceae sp. FL0662B]|nr:hypothetical protein F4779DRAFT_626561 [Xylariaceae sp. FL0662B]
MANGTNEKPLKPVAPRNTASQPIEAESKLSPKSARKCDELARREIWTRDDPNRRVDWSDDGLWEKINSEGYFYQADEVLISCGTVTVDEAESPRPKVLIVYNKVIGIYQLPKGRKQFGEGHLDAALRETSEETGVAVRPLRLRFGSRSTTPKLVQGNRGEIKYGIEDKRTGITEGLCNETIGVSGCRVLTTTPDPDPSTNAWRNHTWWYPRDGTERNENQMTDETDRHKFTTFWFSEHEALSKLKLEDEKYMVRLTFAYLRGMSASDWTSNREQEEEEDNMANATNKIEDLE